MRLVRARLLWLAAAAAPFLAGTPVGAQEGGGYGPVDERPLWTDPVLDDLLQAIRSARDDGLEPEHYNLSALSRSRSAESSSAVAERDLLATDAFVRLSHDLRFGKAEPQGPTHGRAAEWALDGPDRIERIAEIVRAGQVTEYLAEARPRHFVYQGLAAALVDLRRIGLAGGWPAFPSGPALARDSVGARVLLLRQRLRITGDLRGEVEPSSPRFDVQLEEAVRAFQHRHGLNEDGIVGSGTLAALNVPVERRIEQVRVSLERARWVAHELPDTFVVVNVAGALVYLMQGNSVAFETRAIVGTGYTQTPSFAAPMLHVDLNPTWTVPPGIVGEVLGEVRRDAGYLERMGMHVLDATGREIDPSGIDFGRYTAASFPYVFRQDPGPANALGRIKLMFPNEHRVYLHDTPTRGLFAREQRLFSHGCVRVEDPVGLAELVLGDPLRWSRANLDAAIETGETRTIRLPKPVPVYVLYWTAAVDVEGVLHFHPDVYGRDPFVLAALDGSVAGGTPAATSR